MTASWLSKQAGHGQIPCHRLGGNRLIRFSEKNIQEIMKSSAERPIFEIRPRRL